MPVRTHGFNSVGKKYPKLTEVGPRRKETRIGHENDKRGFDRKVAPCAKKPL